MVQEKPTSLLPDDRSGRFLHLVRDDKFIDAAHDIFEQVRPGAHDYLVLGTQPLRHIRRFHPISADLGAALAPGVLGGLKDYAAVFIHFLSRQARIVVARAPAETTFVWLGWGADYYHLIQDRSDLVLPQTRDLLDCIGERSDPRPEALSREMLSAARHPMWTARRIAGRRILRLVGPDAPRERELLNRISALATVLPEDYASIREANPEITIPHMQWNYWTEGFGLDFESDARALGENILLGNSATPENNHLEAFTLLADAPLTGRKVVCPLNYGRKDYADAVSSAGTRLLGPGFVPIREYLQPDAYIDLLRSCSIAAMNHVRQQAMGNIILMLWQGSRLFLNHRCPVRAAMSRMGIETADIRELPDYLRGEVVPVDPTKVADVRDRLVHRFGRDAIVRQTHRLLNTLAHFREPGQYSGQTGHPPATS